jgi:hypothetical protein
MSFNKRNKCRGTGSESVITKTLTGFLWLIMTSWSPLVRHGSVPPTEHGIGQMTDKRLTGVPCLLKPIPVRLFVANDHIAEA